MIQAERKLRDAAVDHSMCQTLICDLVYASFSLLNDICTHCTVIRVHKPAHIGGTPHPMNISLHSSRHLLLVSEYSPRPYAISCGTFSASTTAVVPAPTNKAETAQKIFSCCSICLNIGLVSYLSLRAFLYVLPTPVSTAITSSMIM